MKTLYPSNISTGLYPEIGCVIYVDDQNYQGHFLLKTLYQNQQPSTGKYGQTHSGKLNICSYYVALTGSTGTMFSFEVYLLCPSSSESCFFFFPFSLGSCFVQGSWWFKNHKQKSRGKKNCGYGETFCFSFLLSKKFYVIKGTTSCTKMYTEIQ